MDSRTAWTKRQQSRIISPIRPLSIAQTARSSAPHVVISTNRLLCFFPDFGQIVRHPCSLHTYRYIQYSTYILVYLQHCVRVLVPNVMANPLAARRVGHRTGVGQTTGRRADRETGKKEVDFQSSVHTNAAYRDVATSSCSRSLS